MFITLFFFFKQKTAYEMRISDWSSDVCSSDLNEGRDGHAAIGVSARRPHRIGPPSPQRRSSRSGDGASWTSLFTGDPDDRPRSASRSEEHTSELQSLMRISYAVFCLKKKKQKSHKPTKQTEGIQHRQ